MRYREFAAPSGCPRAPTMRAIMEAVRAASDEWIRPEIGWPSPAGRAALCNGVE